MIINFFLWYIKTSKDVHCIIPQVLSVSIFWFFSVSIVDMMKLKNGVIEIVTNDEIEECFVDF